MRPPFFLTYEQAREGVLAQNPNAEAAFLMVNPDHPSQPNGRDNSVVIGMLGIDCRHYCHTELHPTYAMAIHTYNSTTDDQWKVFARNWGNEGSCGSDQVFADIQSFSVRLGHPNATEVTVKGSDFFGRAGRYDNGTTPLGPPTVGWNISSLVDPGGPDAAVILTMSLPSPDARAVVLGDVSLDWIEARPPSAIARNGIPDVISHNPTPTKAPQPPDVISHNPAPNKTPQALKPRPETAWSAPAVLPQGVTRERFMAQLASHVDTGADDAHLFALVKGMTPAQFDVFRANAPKPNPRATPRALEPIQRTGNLTPARVKDFTKVLRLQSDPIEEQRSRQFVRAICLAYGGKLPGLPDSSSNRFFTGAECGKR